MKRVTVVVVVPAVTARAPALWRRVRFPTSLPTVVASRWQSTATGGATVPASVPATGGATAPYRLSLSSFHPNQSNQRWFSEDSSSKSTRTSPEEEEATVNVTMVDPREDKSEPNDEAHPASSLKGSRDSYTVPVTIRMPDMSEGQDNVIGEWFKKPGDVIKYNDVLCDITTPDFTFGMVVEDEHDGLMGEILVETGQHAPDGAPICIIYHPEPTKSTE